MRKFNNGYQRQKPLNPSMDQTRLLLERDERSPQQRFSPVRMVDQTPQAQVSQSQLFAQPQPAAREASANMNPNYSQLITDQTNQSDHVRSSASPEVNKLPFSNARNRDSSQGPNAQLFTQTAPQEEEKHSPQPSGAQAAGAPDKEVVDLTVARCTDDKLVTETRQVSISPQINQMREIVAYRRGTSLPKTSVDIVSCTSGSIPATFHTLVMPYGVSVLDCYSGVLCLAVDTTAQNLHAQNLAEQNESLKTQLKELKDQYVIERDRQDTERKRHSTMLQDANETSTRREIQNAQSHERMHTSGISAMREISEDSKSDLKRRISQLENQIDSLNTDKDYLIKVVISLVAFVTLLVGILIGKWRSK